MIKQVINLFRGTKNLRKSDVAQLPQKHENFKGQQENEMVICFCRKHYILLLPQLMVFLASSIAVGFSFWAFSQPETVELIGTALIRPIAMVVIILYTWHLHFCILRVFNYYLRILIITDTRVVEIDRTLYFRNNLQSTDLHEIKDINVYQRGFFMTIFDFGTVTLLGGSDFAMKVLKFIPNPDYYFRKIHEAKRTYLATRGRQKGNVSLPNDKITKVEVVNASEISL